MSIVVFPCKMLGSCSNPMQTLTNLAIKPPLYHSRLLVKPSSRKPVVLIPCKFHSGPALVVTDVEDDEAVSNKPKFTWIEVGPNVTEEQKRAIAKLPSKMTKRCKALLKQIICFSPEKTSLSVLLATWVKLMKPRRADWLTVLKELENMAHSMFFQVAELAVLEESFEASTRDYTKIIHAYGKENRLRDAENTLLAMKGRGFLCDQITLTTMVHMYSKAGNLEQAEEVFEELKLLGEPLDKRSYGSMVMAYIRAGMPEQGESVLRQMESEETYPGSEVYKALLRAYSLAGNPEGAQRVFDAIQLAAIPPDARICGLLINAYGVACQSEKARVAFENMRGAGLKPNDKCVALMLSAYEKEDKLNDAMTFLIDLERNGILVGKEASAVLAGWFGRLGVVEEVELVLREYAAANSSLASRKTYI